MVEFLKVDLQMFDDGEGDELLDIIEGSEQSAIAQQSRSPVITSSRTQVDNPLSKVVYGKVADEGEAGASTPNTQGEDKKALWAGIKEQYKEQYGEDVQSIVKDRFKKHSAVEQRLGQVDPIISMLMEKYEAKDEAHLLELVQNDTIETYADREGLSLEQAKETFKVKNENKQLKKQVDEFANKDQQAVIEQQISKWRGEESAIQKEIPEFKLDAFADNKQFMDLLAAGIEMKVIYQVLNLDSIIAKTVQTAQKNTVANIKARGTKVPEAGAKNTPGMLVKSDVNTHTREDRAEINRRVARGETITL